MNEERENELIKHFEKKLKLIINSFYSMKLIFSSKKFI
jgi:hypothetical protein